MAIDRTTENQIAAGINVERRKATRKVYQVGIPLALIASAICPYGIPAWALIWFRCYRSAKRTGAPDKIRGAAGEARALTVLSGLPEEYTLFNQIKLPDERSRTGYRELDYVIVGPNGCYLIENKDYRGRIVGDEFSRNWERHKVGCGGTAYVTEGRNPVRQVQTYVSLLSGIFRSRGITAWITPLVSLSRNNSVDMIHSERVNVVQGTHLGDAILAHKGLLTEENREKVLGVLEELRAGQWEQTMTAQQQVTA